MVICMFSEFSHLSLVSNTHSEVTIQWFGNLTKFSSLVRFVCCFSVSAARTVFFWHLITIYTKHKIIIYLCCSLDVAYFTLSWYIRLCVYCSLLNWRFCLPCGDGCLSHCESTDWRWRFILFTILFFVFDFWFQFDSTIYFWNRQYHRIQR